MMRLFGRQLGSMHVVFDAYSCAQREAAVEQTRFDSWTRRRFGVAVGGLSGALLAMTGGTATKAKKKKCKKTTCCIAVRGSCSTTSGDQCCSPATCGQRTGIEGITVCCIPQGQACTNIPGSQLECCGSLECNAQLVCG
jgi:hypothetical protein